MDDLEIAMFSQFTMFTDIKDKDKTLNEHIQDIKEVLKREIHIFKWLCPKFLGFRCQTDLQC